MIFVRLENNRTQLFITFTSSKHDRKQFYAYDVLFVIMRFFKQLDSSQSLRNYNYIIFFSPPPKFIRRAAPVEPPTVPNSAGGLHAKAESDSAPSSLERNIKPSEILRQKSSDSLDVKLASSYRKTTPDLSKQSDLATEFGQKIKAESLEKNRRPDISQYTIKVW